MEKYIYKGQDITDIIRDKEKDIISLYSKNRGISRKISKKIYLSSKLKKAFRHVENGLWTQSEYYIIEAYASYLDQASEKILLEEKLKNTEFYTVYPPYNKERVKKRGKNIVVKQNKSLHIIPKLQMNKYTDLSRKSEEA